MLSAKPEKGWRRTNNAMHALTTSSADSIPSLQMLVSTQVTMNRFDFLSSTSSLKSLMLSTVPAASQLPSRTTVSKFSASDVSWNDAKSKFVIEDFKPFQLHPQPKNRTH